MLGIGGAWLAAAQLPSAPRATPGVEMRNTRTAAAVVAIIMIAGACGSAEDTAVIEAARADAVEAATAPLETEIATLEASLTEADAAQADLAEQLAEARAELEAANDGIERIGEDAVALAGRASDAESEVSRLERENEQLIAAFDAEIIAARERLAATWEAAACQFGIDVANGEQRAASGTVLVQQIAVQAGGGSEQTEAQQFAAIAADTLDADEVEATVDACTTAETERLSAAALEAERQALAVVLPYVCNFSLYEGRYVTSEGFIEREREFRRYVRDIFPAADSLPTGWDTTDTVVAERERCDELPLQIHTGGTRIVGEEIAPGTYRSAGSFSGFCYWARYSSNGNILNNAIIESAAQISVTVRSSDYSLENDDCGVLFLGTPPSEVPDS